jgi:hypothetical protein
MANFPVARPRPVAREVDPEKSAFVLQIVDNPLNNTVIMLVGLAPLSS